MWTGTHRERGAAALLLVIALAISACGQKPGVAELVSADSLPEGATIDPETGQILDSEGNVIGSSSDGNLTLDQAGGSGSAGAAEAGSSGAEAASSSETDGEAAPVGATGSSTGVTGTLIKIGSHAPLTGAAPVPSDSAQKGIDVYWKWLRNNGDKIHGRFVDAILKNDNYNPSQAVAVCKEMVERDHVFALFGFAGTDQIQACARYAASVGVPYLSAGVTEVGLTDLPNYFAISMSYPDQGPLLADYIQTKLGGKGEKNGILYFDTPNFQDAHDAFVRAMNERGMRLAYDRGVCKCATQTEAQTVVQEMKSAGIENVYVLTSPVWWLQVLQASRTQQYSPQWVGVGITKALDSVSNVGCRNGTIDGARFFSPFPAWIDVDKFDPNFYRAVQTIYPEKGRGDDIMLIGYSASKVIGELLLRTGRDLTRGSFVTAAERARNVKTDTFPTLNFAPNDHFGANTTTVSEARCSDNRWHMVEPYVSDF